MNAAMKVTLTRLNWYRFEHHLHQKCEVLEHDFDNKIRLYYQLKLTGTLVALVRFSRYIKELSLVWGRQNKRRGTARELWESSDYIPQTHTYYILYYLFNVCAHQYYLTLFTQNHHIRVHYSTIICKNTWETAFQTNSTAGFKGDHSTLKRLLSRGIK